MKMNCTAFWRTIHPDNIKEMEIKMRSVPILIIGGGAAGMMAAASAIEQGGRVMVIEKMAMLGKKILATGNGKCNLGNLELSPEMYYSESPEKIPGWLEEFSTQDTISFFEGLGLMIKQKNGYLYPMSEQAATVLDVLRFQIARERRIQVKLQSPVIHMERRKKQEIYFSQLY